MKTAYLFIWLLGFGMLSACAQTKKYYDEDISKYRLKAELVEESAPVAIKSIDIPATNHINDSVNKLMDTVSVRNKNIKLAQGFRILVYTGQTKDDIAKVKEKVYALLSQAEIYTAYRQPDFKIKVGDYLTKIKAFEALGTLRRYFPDALIVPDIVNIKPQ